MDDKILAALITGAATLLATLLNWIFSNLKFSPLPAAKRRIINGSWRGKTIQDSGPQGVPIAVDLVLELKTSWRRISGTCRVSGGGDELNVKIRGGYKQFDHVYWDYSSQDDQKVNFGCVLLKLNGSGDELIGKVIGYGNMSQKLIKGDMILKKIH